MGKTEFLKRLRKALEWTFTEEETADVLADYEGFFASGGAEGKDEGQICAELGEPAGIAQGLAEALEKKRTSPLWFKIFTRMLCTVAVGAAGFAVSTYMVLRDNTAVFIGFILLYAAAAAAMWALLAGFTLKLPPVARVWDKRWKTALFLCHAVLAALVVADNVFFCRVIVTFLQTLSPQIPAAITVYTSSLLPVARFIPLLIAVVSVFGFYRASPQWFTVISHASGASAYFWVQYNNLSNLSTPEDYFGRNLSVIAAYGAAVVITALLAGTIRALSGRRK